VLEGFFKELECLLRELESFFSKKSKLLVKNLNIIYRLVHAFLKNENKENVSGVSLSSFGSSFRSCRALFVVQ